MKIGPPSLEPILLTMVVNLSNINHCHGNNLSWEPVLVTEDSKDYPYQKLLILTQISVEKVRGVSKNRVFLRHSIQYIKQHKASMTKTLLNLKPSLHKGSDLSNINALAIFQMPFLTPLTIHASINSKQTTKWRQQQKTFSAPIVRLGLCGLSLQQSRATFVPLLTPAALSMCSQAAPLRVTLHRECMSGCSSNMNQISQRRQTPVATSTLLTVSIHQFVNVLAWQNRTFHLIHCDYLMTGYLLHTMFDVISPHPSWPDFSLYRFCISSSVTSEFALLLHRKLGQWPLPVKKQTNILQGSVVTLLSAGIFNANVTQKR